MDNEETRLSDVVGDLLNKKDNRILELKNQLDVALKVVYAANEVIYPDNLWIAISDLKKALNEAGINEKNKKENL